MAARRGRPPKSAAAAGHTGGASAARGGSSGGAGGEEPAGALAALPPKQQEGVAALLEHTTVKAAAAACSVHERTLYRWLAEPAFKRAFREARREGFGHSVSLAQRFAPMAITTLAKLASDPKTPPAVRASACMGILRCGREGIELDELVGRVESLEAASAESDAAEKGGRR